MCMTVSYLGTSDRVSAYVTFYDLCVREVACIHIDVCITNEKYENSLL